MVLAVSALLLAVAAVVVRGRSVAEVAGGATADDVNERTLVIPTCEVNYEPVLYVTPKKELLRPLGDEDVTIFENVKTLDSCLEICKTNQARDGSAVLCSAANFYERFGCHIFGSRAIGVTQQAAATLASAPGASGFLMPKDDVIYIEKSCLPGETVRKCGSDTFTRVPDYALNAKMVEETTVESMDQCLDHCIRAGPDECSAVEFYPTRPKNCVQRILYPKSWAKRTRRAVSGNVNLLTQLTTEIQLHAVPKPFTEDPSMFVQPRCGLA